VKTLQSGEDSSVFQRRLLRIASTRLRVAVSFGSVSFFFFKLSGYGG
jgi:hypothetical protein